MRQRGGNHAIRDREVEIVFSGAGPIGLELEFASRQLSLREGAAQCAALQRSAGGHQLFTKVDAAVVVGVNEQITLGRCAGQ